MKIREVRDGIIKFDTDNTKVNLSSFLKIDGNEKSYIAQVIQIKDNDNTAFAKILFLYNNGTILGYDKTLPTDDSEITEFTSDILKNAIYVKNPVIAGKTEDEQNNIVVDSSVFNKKMLISVDDKNGKNILIRNLVKQFNNINQKVIIIDTLGDIDAKKYVSGVDFKLPLDKQSLRFMYEECMNDVTEDSKSTIIEIFRDLADYSQTVEFLPFETLKTIVDDMVDKSHIFKLLVLKNKLSKFDRLGYFAKNNNEVSLVEKIVNSKCAIIDVSKLDSAFQNKYISYIYEKVDSKSTRIILELSNTISKKSLKNILASDVNTTFVTHSKFKYINDIKNLFDNFIIFPSTNNNILFNIYSTFLRAMNKNSYLIVGEGTNYIPVISKLKQINEIIEYTSEDDMSVFDEIAAQPETSDLNMKQDGNGASVATNKIIASIDKKNMDTISDITKEIVEPDDMEMFTDTDETVVTEIPENTTEEISENSAEEIITEIDESGENEDTEVLLTVNEDVSSEDSKETNMTENNGESADSESTDEVSEDNSLTEELHAEESDIVTDEFETSIELDENIDLDLYSEPDSDDSNQETEEFSESEKVEDNIPAAQDNEEVLEAAPINEDIVSDDDFIELNPEESNENDILIEMEDDFEVSDENIDEEIKREVDKVYTTRKEDDYSETDLDLIDEINNDEETLVNEDASNDDSLLEELTEEDDNQILEEYHPETSIQDDVPENEILETRSSTTPIVPVYDAEIPQEDRVESDPVQQGDTVTHIKYGNGIVEKLVKYGNKTLFMINFEMGGRKLLDPMLAEIKKA